MTDIITAAINVLRTVHQRQDEYDLLNSQAKALQGDFHTHVQFADDAFLEAAIKLADTVLCNNASYFLWVIAEGHGRVVHIDGTEYAIESIDDVEAYARRFSPFAVKAEANP